MRRQRNLLGPQGMGGMVGLWGASSLIKSIQRGSISIGPGVDNSTTTISSVDMANTTLAWLGSIYNGGADVSQQNYLGRITLTNATTITAQRQALSNTITIGYEVVEYLPGAMKSIQRGTATMTNTFTSGTATVTGVNTAKSFFVFGGVQAQPNTGYGIDTTARVTLTNGTTVTFDRAGTANFLTTSFHLIEMF